MTLDDHPIDDDYIDVDKQPADISTHEPTDDELQYKFDASHTYDRSNAGVSGDASKVPIDEKRVVDRDDRGGTRTGFLAADVSDGYLSRAVTREGKTQKYAQWLMTLQDGHRAPNRDVDNSKADDRRYSDTFTSALDMTTHQRRRVERIVDSVNMKHMAHYPSEIVILGIISIVANEDDRWVRDEHTFKELVTSLDGSMDDVKNARILVKQKSDML